MNNLNSTKLIQALFNNNQVNQGTVDIFYTAVNKLTIMEKYYMIKAFKVCTGSNKDYYQYQNELTRDVIREILENLYVGADGANDKAAFAGMGNLPDYVTLFEGVFGK